MIIADKIVGANDKTIFTLHREGLFYKCYNQDAMVFAQRVKNYKVTVLDSFKTNLKQIIL